ncbi:MAG TPA: hypothetical protein VN670_01890 [Acidobacteriaceae bacterium]|nr:hypothetical protein [Acidobacteriaceae bacterium]
MIKAAKINADAAASFSISAKGIDTEITNAVAQLGFQVGALRDNIKQTNGLADATKAGISENRSAIGLENRAWLGITNERIVQFAPGKPVKVDIFLTNSGRTPANAVRTAVNISVNPQIVVFPASLGSFMFTTSVPPQGSRIVYVTSKSDLSGIQVAQFKNKSMFLIVSGTIDYEDFNRVQRATNICMYMSDPSTKEFAFCETGNGMD